jgi:hypothetical protein
MALCRWVSTFWRNIHLLSWRWRQYVPVKYLYPSIWMHGILAEKATIWIFNAMESLNLRSVITVVHVRWVLLYIEILRRTERVCSDDFIWLSECSTCLHVVHRGWKSKSQTSLKDHLFKRPYFSGTNCVLDLGSVLQPLFRDHPCPWSVTMPGICQRPSKKRLQLIC